MYVLAMQPIKWVIFDFFCENICASEIEVHLILKNHVCDICKIMKVKCKKLQEYLGLFDFYDSVNCAT